MSEDVSFQAYQQLDAWTQTSFAHVTEDTADNYRTFGQKMDVDPNNPNVVYVGTPQNGLFVTTDGGTTWQSVSAVPVSQTDGSGVYPASPGSYRSGSWYDGRKDQYHLCFSYGNGVYESTNVAPHGHIERGPSSVEYAAVSSTASIMRSAATVRRSGATRTAHGRN